MEKLKSVVRIIFVEMVSVTIFIILLIAANLFSNFFNNPYYIRLVSFLNDNFILLILISVFFITSELLWVLVFPFNLPAPLFGAVSGVFILFFVTNLLRLIENFLGIEIISPFEDYLYWIYVAIFFAVFLLGYARLIKNLRKNSKNSNKNKWR